MKKILLLIILFLFCGVVFAMNLEDYTWEKHDNNPILSIHDQGAGGIGNVLKELVEEKFINKKVHNTIPIGVEYSLTERGKEFIKAFKSVEKWSKKWNIIK